MKILLKIGGMSCAGCSSGLEKYLNKQNGVVLATVNLVMNNALIEYDEKTLKLEQIEEFVKQAGFESLGIDKLKEEEKEIKGEKTSLVFLAIFSFLALYISMAPMVGLPTIQLFREDQNPINYAILLFALTIPVIYICKKILKSGYLNTIHKTPNMDTLVSLGVMAAFLYSIFGTYMVIQGDHSYAHLLYYETAIVVLFFIKIGKYIEGKSKDKTKEAIKGLMQITPNNTTILKDGKEVIVTIDEIRKRKYGYMQAWRKNSSRWKNNKRKYTY